MDGGVSTAAILAAITVSEGIRAAAPGAVTVQRLLGGQWRAIEPLALGRGFVLPSLSPFSVAVVARPVVPDEDARLLLGTQRYRLAAVDRNVVALRVFGALSFAALVVGVPALTARSGWFGLVTSLAALLLLAIAQAILLHAGLRRLGLPRGIALARASRVLWPFTTPRSAELLLESATQGMPPMVVARALLDDTAFHALARPIAYDALHARDGGDTSILRALCGDDELRAIVARPPRDDARYCPRCAAGYADAVRECVDCEGVALVAG